MKTNYLLPTIMVALLGICNICSAKDYASPPRKGKSNPPTNFRAACTTAQAQTDLDINNVRARLLTGGDMWWNRSDGGYVVPKPQPGQPEVSAIFAGGIWMGGLDEGGNLKVACQTYGNASGNSDYWPGPLTPDEGITDGETCNNWDRHFEVKGLEIYESLGRWAKATNQGIPYTASDIPLGVKGWPGKGNPYFQEVHGFDLPNTDQGMADYYDQNFDGIYDPLDGDFPFAGPSSFEANPRFPDQLIFWVYNDEGGGAIHGETNASPIRMEVQATAFAYVTDDQINDMTFQHHKFINRATEDIDDFYIGLWLDVDLGCGLDDYVGCDPDRSLAYYYNADAVDGQPGASCNGVATYGTTVPALGIDFFQGPRNESGVELAMSSFIYYNSAGFGMPTGNTDPDTDLQFYRILQGKFRDGTPLTKGGTGYDPSSTEITTYAFPSQPNDPNGWSMCQPGPDYPNGLPANDRRTVQSFGPFILQPGSINEMLFGVIYAPDMPYPCPDMSKLFYADDLAECFMSSIHSDGGGPADAPDMDFVELDREIIGLLSNQPAPNSNNYQESYNELIPCDFGIGDNTYSFEGYLVYQLVGEDVPWDSINFPEYGRLVFQTDLKNGVKTAYNWESIPNPSDPPLNNQFIHYPVAQVEGKDDGIKHSFRLTTDAFVETGDNRLVNHRTYYYLVKAYDYNQFMPFNPITLMGQKTEYQDSRRNIKIYKATPRPILDQQLNTAYGEPFPITRIDGVGVGGNFVDMDDATLQHILDGSFTGEISYVKGRGPIEAKVYNPLAIVEGEYEVTFVDEDMTNDQLDNEVRWQLKRLNSNDPPILSDQTIDVLNEQLFAQYGFAVTIGQTLDVGDCEGATSGEIGAESVYKDAAGPQWFSAIDEGFSLAAPGFSTQVFDYLNSGNNSSCDLLPLAQMGDGFFVPYQLCNFNSPNNNQFIISPAWRSAQNSLVVNGATLNDLNNVDIVFTPDKSLWSRCVVVETMSPDYPAFAQAESSMQVASAGSTASNPILSFDLRNSPSVGKEDSNNDGLPEPDGDGIGMGWFPGYAIDVETGKRLNIFFGENSAFSAANGFISSYPGGKPNGADMLFNPNSQMLLEGAAEGNFLRYYAGGQHFVYVTNEEYDGCEYLRSRFDPNESDLKKVNALRRVTWASMTLLLDGATLLPLSQGLIPNEYKVKLRVDNPYQVSIGTGDFNGYPTYRFKVADLASVVYDVPALKTVLKEVNVAPNPFYNPAAYANGEGTGVVKITNLPPKCTITVYSMDGNTVRQFQRNEQPGQPNGTAIEQTQIVPDFEWDVTNAFGKQLATGVYLIHVNAPGIGERTLKLVVI